MNRKIHFQPTGRKKQHEITLFEITEHNIDMASALCSESRSTQSYAEMRLTHYMTQTQAYLMSAGYDDTSSFFRVNNGEVVKCQLSELGKPLWAAIEERDQFKGQTGEYLAALIDHKCRTLINTWPPNHNVCSAVLDNAMAIQELFFQLFLLENVQSQYSAGKSRTHEANQGFLKFKTAVIDEYLKQTKKCSKQVFSKLMADTLNKKHPHEKTPTHQGIRTWLKNI